MYWAHTWNAEFVNCRFSEIPYVYNVKIRGIKSRVENCLFTNMDWWANPGGGGAELGNSYEMSHLRTVRSVASEEVI